MKKDTTKMNLKERCDWVVDGHEPTTSPQPKTEKEREIKRFVESMEINFKATKKTFADMEEEFKMIKEKLGIE